MNVPEETLLERSRRVLREYRGLLELSTGCTGLTASWCAVCGSCTCPDCPLHAPDSLHAEAETRPRTADA